MAGRARDNKPPRTLTIPAPIAREGDRVEVLNYRKRPAQWEAGELESLNYTPPFLAKGRHASRNDVGSWHYTVRTERLVRRPRFGNMIALRLHVGDDQIRRRARS